MSRYSPGATVFLSAHDRAMQAVRAACCPAADRERESGGLARHRQDRAPMRPTGVDRFLAEARAIALVIDPEAGAPPDPSLFAMCSGGRIAPAAARGGRGARDLGRDRTHRAQACVFEVRHRAAERACRADDQARASLGRWWRRLLDAHTSGAKYRLSPPKWGHTPAVSSGNVPETRAARGVARAVKACRRLYPRGISNLASMLGRRFNNGAKQKTAPPRVVRHA